jgi:hypothetical protein
MAVAGLIGCSILKKSRPYAWYDQVTRRVVSCSMGASALLGTDDSDEKYPTNSGPTAGKGLSSEELNIKVEL